MIKRLGESIWGHRRWFFIGLVLLTAVWVVVSPQTTPGFPDADSYYHGHIAQLMLQQGGFVHEYPWFRYMVWNDGFVDGHLGYHVWLMPFVGIWGVELGMRLSAVAGAVLAFTTLWLIVRFWHPRWSLWLTWLAMLTYAFSFRVSLPRAPALALVLLLPFSVMVVQGRWFGTMVLSLLFGWYYHSWPVLTMLTLINIFVGVVAVRFRRKPGRWQPLVSAVKAFAGHLVGIMVSFVVNPYFPQNIVFAVTDILEVGPLNDHQAVRLGGEWYPMDPLLLHTTVGPIILLITAAASVVILARHYNLPEMVRPVRDSHPRALGVYGITTGIFLFLTLGAQRYTEYFLPFAIIFAALLLRLVEPFIDRLMDALKQMGRPTRSLSVALTLTVTLFPLAIHGRSLPQYANTNVDDRQSAAVSAPALDALARRLPPGSLVWHNRWDDGSVFAYEEPRLRYLIGLAPSFFYLYDREAYLSWNRVATSSSPEPDEIVNLLGARGVIIRTLTQAPTETPLGQALRRDPAFEEVYADDKIAAYIYHFPVY